jgi:hypothetical protein
LPVATADSYIFSIPSLFSSLFAGSRIVAQLMQHCLKDKIGLEVFATDGGRDRIKEGVFHFAVLVSARTPTSQHVDNHGGATKIY